MKKRWIIKICCGVFFSFHLAFFLATIFPVFRLRQHNPAYTSLMRYRGESKKSPPRFLPFREIPINVARCLVFIEDARFYSHRGVDFKSVLFALRVNNQAGEIVYGGSTISQQLARTLFLNPRRTYVRKYLEMLLALELEWFLGKDRILELYLNYAEWGKGTYGIADAAVYHFNRELSSLDTREQLQLLTILPNPLVFTLDNFRENAMLRRRYAALISFSDQTSMYPPVFHSIIREINR